MPPIQHFAPPPGLKAPPLSFATRVGDLLFVSGIPGFDDKGALPDSFEAQFGNVVINIKRVLDKAGAGFRDLVKVSKCSPDERSDIRGDRTESCISLRSSGLHPVIQTSLRNCHRFR